MQRVLEQNLDLAAAMARIQQARAAANHAGAERLPEGSASASIEGERQSLNSPFGEAGQLLPGYTRNQSLTDLGIGASWELDIFGGLKRGAEAADAQAQAAQADGDGVRISVAAEAADAYFRVRGAAAAHCDRAKPGRYRLASAATGDMAHERRLGDQSGIGRGAGAGSAIARHHPAAAHRAGDSVESTFPTY